MAKNKTFLLEKQHKSMSKTSSLSTVVRPTMTHIKQQKYFWYLSSTLHISLQLIYAVRPWPYMRIPAWSQWIAIYLHILLKYTKKHKAYAASYNNIRPTLKAFFVRATKNWSIVGLVRQSWYKNHCWCSTTVSDRVERWHNRTALIKLILYS